MIVLVWRRSKKLKADKKVQVGKDQEKAQSEKDSHSKNNISWIYGIMWLRLQMADLNVVRSSERTAEVGRLFHCTIATGKMNICSS